MELSPIRYTRAPDGAEIAWAEMGSGPPLLHFPYVPTCSGIELVRHVGEFQRWCEGLAAIRRVVLFDFRRFGYSAPEPADSIDTLVSDAVAVAGELGSTELGVLSAGPHASLALHVALAVPELASQVVLCAPILRGPEQSGRTPSKALRGVGVRDWDLYARTVTGWSDLPADERAPYQQVVADTGSAAAYEVHMRTLDSIEPPDDLAELRAQTLVVQMADDDFYPGPLARRAAATIPGARLAVVSTPYSRPTGALDAVRAFLTEGAERRTGVPSPQRQSPPDDARLSPRELEVLRIVAEGKTNAEIAEVLVIAPNTVARHVKSILAKTGAANRAQAAAYAARRGLLG